MKKRRKFSGKNTEVYLEYWNKTLTIGFLKQFDVFCSHWEKMLGNKKLKLISSDLGQKEIEWSLTFCGTQRIKSLNREYRGKDYATDVLSFPLLDLREEMIPDLANESKILLGDIIICLPVAKRQAKEFGISLEEEIFHLIVHGLLHLCGYDHEISKKEELIMERWERKVLESFFLKIKK